jgi:hypothetical protein
MTGTSFALRGQVSQGLFDTEAVVSFKDAKGEDVSLLAPSTLILEGPNGQVIRIRVLQRNGNLFLVRLPGEVYGGGPEVTVREDQLEKV